MNIQKLIAIVAAIAINCAVLAWFHAWTSGVASAAAAAASTQGAVMLPAIDVHPSAEQLRELRKAHAMPEPGVSGYAPATAIPYYSFGGAVDVAADG